MLELQPHAVFFDLFETLVTEIGPGWRPPGSTPAQRLGISDETYRRVRRSCHDKGMTHPVDYRDILIQACHAAGVELTDAKRSLVEDLHAQRLQEKAAPFSRIDPSVLKALHQINALGVRLGVISNCSAEEVVAWGTSPLAAMVDDAVLSFQVGHLKPEPEIYLLACRRLDVSPGHAVFVGDGGSDELRGAANVGMKAYAARWFVTRWPQQLQEVANAAAAEFTALADLDSLVATIRDLQARAVHRKHPDLLPPP